MPDVDSPAVLRQRLDALQQELATARQEIDRLRQAPAPARRGRSFEDVGVRFYSQHVGKVWLGLLLVAATVVAVQERLI